MKALAKLAALSMIMGAAQHEHFMRSIPTVSTGPIYEPKRTKLKGYQKQRRG